MGEIQHPQRAVPRKYLLPILFLADRMASSDGEVVEQESRMIDVLAEAVDMKNFREERDYRVLSDQKACETLDAVPSKNAALVVISLILKSDLIRKDEESVYFKKVRGLLGASPVTVPSDLAAHRALALEYLR